MKISTGQAQRFIGKPDPAVRAVLVYGPDGGLVRERIEALLRSVVEDPNDPFRVAELDAAALRDDPARLADEAAALALTGGRRVVRIRGAGDGLSDQFKAFLSDPPGEALILLEAGELPARSSLRKVFEAARNAAALACYHDAGRDLSEVIEKALATAGLVASPDALAYLGANLGADRQLTRRELEKLVLYKGSPAEGDPATRRVELADVQACIGDSSELTLENIAFAVGDGDLQGIERGLTRSLQEGAQPISVLRGVARHFQRLHLVVGQLKRGVRVEDALKRLRPPLFWKTADRFRGQAARWDAPALATALESLLTTEAACKRTASPVQALVSRALLQIAANAPRRQRAR